MALGWITQHDRLQALPEWQLPELGMSDAIHGGNAAWYCTIFAACRGASAPLQRSIVPAIMMCFCHMHRLCQRLLQNKALLANVIQDTTSFKHGARSTIRCQMLSLCCTALVPHKPKSLITFSLKALLPSSSSLKALLLSIPRLFSAATHILT